MVFALNRQWLLNEKGALALAATFPLAPKDLQPRMERAFDISADAATLSRKLHELGALGFELSEFAHT